MARASIPTLLSLDRFFQLIGMHPLHANGVYLPDALDQFSCGRVITQYSWQLADAISRDEIAMAIDEAERSMAEILGYDVGIRWQKDDYVPLYKPANPELLQRRYINVMGGDNSVRASHGYILEGGIEAFTLLHANSSVTYSARFVTVPAQEYNDVATITVDITGSGITDTSEIAVYYPVSIVGGLVHDPAWEVRPITCTLSGNTLTVKMARQQLVAPQFLEGYDLELKNGVDGTDDSNFLTTVDVYRRYNDPSRQVEFVWDPKEFCMCPGFIEDATGCIACGGTTQYGCMMVRNRRLGFVSVAPSHWDVPTDGYLRDLFIKHRQPDRAWLNYRAGYYNPNVQPISGVIGNDGVYPIGSTADPVFERAVAHFALALLPRPICGCTGVVGVHEYYATDMALQESEAQSSTSYITGYWPNRFGTKRGAIEAWHLCWNMALAGKAPHG